MSFELTTPSQFMSGKQPQGMGRSAMAGQASLLAASALTTCGPCQPFGSGESAHVERISPPHQYAAYRRPVAGEATTAGRLSSWAE